MIRSLSSSKSAFTPTAICPGSKVGLLSPAFKAVRERTPSAATITGALSSPFLPTMLTPATCPFFVSTSSTVERVIRVAPALTASSASQLSKRGRKMV